MSRLPLLPVLVLTACSDFNLALTKPDDTVGGVDTDVGLPLPQDTDVPDTDVPPPADTDPSVATFAMYAHSNIDLFSVEPTTAAVTKIGRFLTPNGAAVAMADIAIDLRGRLFAGSYEATSAGAHTIYTVMPTTAAVTRLCEVDVALTGMTFLSDGRLVAATEHALTLIDLANGCATSELYRDNNVTTSGDVVGLPDGKLYWTVTGSGNDVLMRVDPVAKTARTVGTTGSIQLYGLGYDEASGVLYGFSSFSQRVVTIDPRDATTRVVQGTTPQYWWGATTNPVVW